MTIVWFLVMLAVGIWLGWRLCKGNTRNHGLITDARRSAAINDEADMGECR